MRRSWWSWSRKSPSQPRRRSSLRLECLEDRTACSVAPLLTLGEPVVDTVADAESDLFEFRIADTPGSGRLTATVRGTSGDLLPRLTLSDGNGALLIQSDSERLAQHLTPGTYFLTVSARSGAGSFQLDTAFVPTSAPLSPLAAGAGTFTVVVADVNHDDLDDVITGNRIDNTVSVFLNSGDGTFLAPRDFAVGARVYRLETSDVNSDGHPDLLSGNKGDNTASVLLGNGDGTFQPQILVLAGTRINGALAADVDGDGIPDMIQDNYADDTIWVLRGNGDGTFGPPTIYPADDQGQFQGPSEPEVIDVNGDGVVDLLHSNYVGSSIAVRLGLGDGTFGPQRLFVAGAGCGELEVSDVNDDGRLDLVGINSVGNSVSILLGNGDGTFGAHTEYPVGGNPYSGAVADFNGDDIADVVTGNRDDNTVSVLLGRGDGTFLPQRVFRTGSTPPKVVVGDFNGDGRPDLVSANQGDNTVSVLLGNGDGTFVTDEGSLSAPAARPFQVVIADLNRDGRPDIATANRSDNSVGVLLSNADGSFQTRETFGVDLQPFGITSADVNGDGIPDLLTANYAGGSVSILLGLGDGTFAPHQDLTAGSNAYAVRVDDVNDDDIPDVLCTNKNDNTVGVFLGLGTGAFADMVTYDVANGPFELVPHDLNDDGAIDIVVSHFSAEVVDVLLGNGDGTFQPTRQYPVGSRPYGLAVADVNGDGVPDVVTSNYRSGDVSVLLGNGDGSLQSPTLLRVGVAPNQVQVGDVNGDGLADLITANYGSNDISVLLGNGSTFDPEQRFPAGPGPASVAVEDITGDDRLDLVVANRKDSTVHVLAGNGDAAFGDPIPFGASKNRYSETLADVNGDGKLDLLTTRLLQNSVLVQLGNGTGTFEPGQALTVGTAPTAVAVADLNGDGRPDLAITNSGSDNVSVLLGNGDGSFGMPRTLPVGRSPRAVALVDLNGDGSADLVATNYHDASVSVLMGRGDGTFATPLTLGVGAKPYALAVANVTGDGIPDLIVANSADGSVSLLAGNGDGTFQIPLTLSTGRQPFAVTVADVTNDGVADIVTADAFDNAVSILPGGNLTQRQSVAVGERPYAVAVADVNGDGRADIVTTNLRSQSITLLLNDGAGGFQREQTLTPDPLPTLTVLGDVNNDGRDDLVTVSNQSRAVGVQLGRGDGTFQMASAATEVGLRNAPVLSDLDGDGVRDRLLLNRAGEVLFRKGLSVAAGGFASPIILNPSRPATDIALVDTGTGLAVAVAEARFDPALSDNQLVYTVSLYILGVGRTTAFSTTALAARLVAADLNGDGRDELIAANSLADTVSIVAQTAPGQFGVPHIVKVGRTPSDIAVTDVDGDDRPDVLVGNQVSGDVSVLLNDATHSFANALRFRATPGLYGLDAASVTPAVQSFSQSVSVASGDFTGDGLVDLIVVNRGVHSFTVLPGNGQGGFDAPQLQLTTSTSDGFRINDRPGAIAAGDFDRDGHLDLATLIEDRGAMWIFSGNGDGTFVHTFSLPIGDQGTGLTVIPGSEAGLLDLLVGNGFGDVLHLEGRGDGSFQIRGKRVSLSVIPDLFGAGQAGVLVGNQQDNRVTVQTATSGGGGFSAVQTLGSEDTSGQLAPGDVQFARLRGGDALPDALVVSTGSNAVVVYRTTAVSGGVPAFSSTTQTFFVGTSPASASVVDVNGDDVMDLLVANQGSNDVSVVFGSLVGGNWVGSAGPRLKSGGAGPIAVTARDMTGDGIGDLVVTNGDSGTLTVLPGVGQGFFDDRSPSTLFTLGGALVQAPSFLGASGVGYAVTVAGEIVRFNLNDPLSGSRVVFAGQNVLAARVVDGGQIVVALAGGAVQVLSDQGDSVRVVAQLEAEGAVPVLPSSLEVIQTRSGQLQVLVSSQGSDTIFVFGQSAAPGVDVPVGGGSDGGQSLSGPSTPAGVSSQASIALANGSGSGLTTGADSAAAAIAQGTSTGASLSVQLGAALGGTFSTFTGTESNSNSGVGSASLVSLQGNNYATVAVLDFGGGSDDDTGDGRGRDPSLSMRHPLGDASPLTRFVTGQEEAIKQFRGAEPEQAVDPQGEDVFPPRKPSPTPSPSDEEQTSLPGVNLDEVCEIEDPDRHRAFDALAVMLALGLVAPFTLWKSLSSPRMVEEEPA